MVWKGVSDGGGVLASWELPSDIRHTPRAAAPELMAEVLEFRARLEQAEHDADRYYVEMCRRPAPAEPTASRETFAELSRAARHEATMDRMFPRYAGARA